MNEAIIAIALTASKTQAGCATCEQPPIETTTFIRVVNDPFDISMYYLARGLPREAAFHLGEHAYDTDLDVSFEHSEPLLLSHALTELEKFPAWRDDFEMLSLSVDWQELFERAVREDDFIGTEVCRDYIEDVH